MNKVIYQEKNGNSSTSMKDLLNEFEMTRNLCKQLMETPHYSKIGAAGIFAIIHKAITLGIPPFDALNGSLYYVNGKVEMSAALMARLIRQKNHSITIGKGSGSESCTLHGKRADSGDTMSTSFSIAEAKKAGLVRKDSGWEKFPEDMCYSRALSRLARRLFPDVISGCYVEGEIPRNKDDEQPNFSEEFEDAVIDVETEDSVPEPIIPYIDEIEALLTEQPDRRANLMSCIRMKWGVHDFSDLTIENAKWIITRLKLPTESNKQEEVA